MRFRVMKILQIRKADREEFFFVRLSVEQMAFDAKALSETNRQVSWLSPSFRHLLRRCLRPMAFCRRENFCDLQLRDSSRFARDSLLATLFTGRNLIVHFFQSAVADVRTLFKYLANAAAKVIYFYGLAKEIINK